MPDVRGKRVLIFGDSLSAGTVSPGAVLAQHLNASGATVRVDARVGRSAYNFYGREDVRARLEAARAFDPDIVIVVLGTNDIGLSMKVDGQRMTQLRDELRQTAEEVWAFGPPSFPASGPGSTQHAGAPAVVAMMRSVFGRRFIDLRPASADLVDVGTSRTSDGVHFTGAGARTLGERMHEQIVRASDTGAAAAVVFAAAIVGAWFWLR